MAPEQTLREKWANDTFGHTTKEDAYAADWFIAQFDAMLAEDITEIEIMIDILHSRPRNSYENGVWVALTKAKSILEARRLSLKK